ncbi:MAG: ABC transporter permease [Tannerellaceae bacterium]|nr:ABC transporter permease [Tannerellaceae bacterium]
MNNLFNLRSYFKFLSKNFSYTVIDIFGLSISLMFVILIATYTVQELSRDNFQENKHLLYGMGTEDRFGTAYRLSDRLLERYPEIDKICVTSTHISQRPVTNGDNKINATLLFADSTFFDMFSFNLLEGDIHTAFESRTSAILSQSFARKMFPDRNPIGQVIKFTDDFSVTVTGVMKNINNSVIPDRDILIRMDNIKHFNQGMDSHSYNNAGSAMMFVQAKPGADLKSREGEVADYFREIFWIFQREIQSEIHFIPLKDLYFAPQQSYGLIEQGEWKFVMILMSIGIVILIFAMINYINLTVAQTGFRAKEMAIRRLLGSSRWELFARLMIEATFLTFISFILGIFLAFLFKPFADTLLETTLDLPGMFTFGIVIISLLVIVAIGFLAGLLPATIISSAKPVEVVKGTFRQKTKMVFSKFFITFQNVITITLLAVSITMITQVNHLIDAPLGYNKENILTINADLSDEQFLKLGNELSQLACVKQVSFSEGTPLTRGNNNTVVYEDRNISFQIFQVDAAYVDMLKLEIIKDNHLGNPDGYYLNEQALRELNITDETPSVTIGNWVLPIAGIVKDYHLANITHTMDPVLMQIRKPEDFDYGIWHMLVEVIGDHREAYLQIQEIYENLSGLDFSGQFIDYEIQESFASQKRTSKMVMVFTFIAMIISLLGLFAMSTYFIQQRAREVAVRKVFGSTNTEVLLKLVGTFLNYVGIAFLIAIPIIWYFMTDWLSEYSYRITLAPWIYITAGLFCLVISFISVYWQSQQAANSNPAHSIKSE